MPRSCWCILVAFVGWLSLAAAQQPAKQQHGHTSAQQTQPAKPPEPPYAAYPNKYSDACYSAQNHDAADLCAQWRAAFAAEKAAHEARRATFWAIVAAFLTFATVIGLIVSVWQTFGALGEARRGNLIAQRANARATRQAIRSAEDTKAAIAVGERQANIAEDTAKRQLRAYLHVTGNDNSPVQVGTPVVANVTVTNGGQTPAHDVIVEVMLTRQIVPIDLVAFDLPPKDENPTSRLVVSGTQPVYSRTELAPTTQVEFNAFHAGQAAYYTYGRISYRDVFNDTHETLFRQELLRSGVWQVCGDGNQAD